MTVKELIKRLKRLDQSRHVLIHIPDGDSEWVMYEVTHIKAEKTPIYDGEGGDFIYKLPSVILKSDEYHG